MYGLRPVFGVRHEAARHTYFPASRGLIQTDMGEQTFCQPGAQSRQQRCRRGASSMSRHPIGQLGVPDDIAKGIVFLASDDSGFMTGAGFVIDGGSTAQ